MSVPRPYVLSLLTAACLAVIAYVSVGGAAAFLWCATGFNLGRAVGEFDDPI